MKKLLNLLSNNYFFCIYYLFTSFSFITFLNNIPYINLLPKIALIWGLLLSFKNIISILKRKPTSIEFFIILLLSVTLILNITAYFNLENIKCWIVNLILLTSIFYINTSKDTITLENELNIITNFYIIITFVFSFISLILFLFNITISLNSFIIGNHNGVFENENSLGISAVIAVMLSIYSFTNKLNKHHKLFLITNIIIQICSIIISTSRSTLFVLIAVFLCLILIKIKNNIARAIIIFAPFLSTFLCMFINHDLLFKFTSGRNELWLSAFTVVKDNYLIGIGNSALVQTVSDARYIYLPGIKFGGLHNIYIQILTTNGIFAFISFISLLLVSAFYIINNTKVNSKEFIIFALLIGIMLINLYESNIFYIVSFISIVFWTYLGYIISIIKAKKRDEK